MDISILNKATKLVDTTIESYKSSIRKINDNNTEDIKLINVEGMRKIVESITDNPDSQGNYYSVIMKILECGGKH